MNKNKSEWIKNELKLAKKHKYFKEYDKELDCVESICELMDKDDSLDLDFIFSELDRIHNDFPLTPINEDDEFEYIDDDNEGGKFYKSKRGDFLFKHVNAEGKVDYEDLSFEVNDSNDLDIHESVMSLVGRILFSIYPITFPYHKNSENFKIYVRQGKSHNSDEINAVYIDSIIAPWGDEFKVDGCFIRNGFTWNHVYKGVYLNHVEEFDLDDLFDCDYCDDDEE